MENVPEPKQTSTRVSLRFTRCTWPTLTAMDCWNSSLENAFTHTSANPGPRTHPASIGFDSIVKRRSGRERSSTKASPRHRRQWTLKSGMLLRILGADRLALACKWSCAIWTRTATSTLSPPASPGCTGSKIRDFRMSCEATSSGKRSFLRFQPLATRPDTTFRIEFENRLYHVISRE